MFIVTEYAALTQTIVNLMNKKTIFINKVNGGWIVFFRIIQSLSFIRFVYCINTYKYNIFRVCRLLMHPIYSKETITRSAQSDVPATSI